MNITDTTNTLIEIIEANNLNCSITEKEAIKKASNVCLSVERLIEYLDFLYYTDLKSIEQPNNTHIDWYKRGSNAAIDKVYEYLKNTMFDEDDRIKYGV